MGFFTKHRKAINIVIALTIIAESLLSVVINLLTQGEFSFLSRHNIVLFIIFIVLIVLLIVFNIIQYNIGPKTKTKRLQKAFQENGGYEVVVDEMKKCFREHDMDSLKDLKKMIEIIEK